MTITAENITTWAFGVAVLLFLWRLHVDVSNVKERLARLEGQIDLLMRGLRIEIQGTDQ